MPATSHSTATARGTREGPSDEIGRIGATNAALRWLGAQLWRASLRAGRNRSALYGGAVGLRIVAFHGTQPRALEVLKRVVGAWRERRPVATPAEVDDLVAGRWRAGQSDRLLLTFDDGLASNYDAAVWLANAGLQAVFFVVPSFVDRTVAEFVRYHDERGVRAIPPVRSGEVRGLSTGQVREMRSMGHRIGAHNNAHRDLGRLTRPADLRYEIGDALERVRELVGAECRDFAVGFGQPHNLSAPAAAHLERSCPNVYMCHRGLNVPGRTPRFLLRHAAEPGHPLAFTRICLEGGADHRLADRIRSMEARVGLLPSGIAADAARRVE